MISIALLIAASADLDSLNRAVAACDRGMVNPVFSAEAGQRSTFLLNTYREQESIVAARLDVSQRRATLREAGVQGRWRVKDAQVEIKKATERAVIYGKCPSVTGKFDGHSFPSTGWVMCANAEQSWSRRGDAN